MENKYKKYFLNKALQKNARIMLPEENDSRIRKAIKQLNDIGFNVIRNKSLKGNENIYFELVSKKKFTHNWTEKMIKDFIKNPLHLSILALDNNDIDCVIAGAENKTSDVIRSAIRIVGIKKRSKFISSIFIMLSPDNKNIYTFTDCGVIPEPTSEQLSNIAFEASRIHELVSQKEPKVAFLSFSTKGSAQHYKVKKIQDAVNQFSSRYPTIKHDGEIQFDAAIDPFVSMKKIKNSSLKGKANVFVFPDLDSANIAYKITQYLAGYQALGPILVGLNKPINDLSRGCSIDDIVHISAISALQV